MAARLDSGRDTITSSMIPCDQLWLRIEAYKIIAIFNEEEGDTESLNSQDTNEPIFLVLARRELDNGPKWFRYF